jgi:hypothetical protein
MPKELYKGYKALMASLRKGDPNVIESLQGTVRAGAVVRGDDLHVSRVGERAVSVAAFVEAVEPLRQAPALRGILSLPAPATAEASRFAGRTLSRNLDAAPSADVPVSSGRVMPRALRNSLAEPAVRIRDWNPDVPVAQRLGVSIRYLSRSNEISCPELNLRSNFDGRPVRLGSSSVSASSGGSSGAAGSSGGMSSGGSVSSSGGSASAGSSGASSSTSSGGGGHIK